MLRYNWAITAHFIRSWAISVTYAFIRNCALYAVLNKLLCLCPTACMVVYSMYIAIFTMADVVADPLIYCLGIQKYIVSTFR